MWIWLVLAVFVVPLIARGIGYMIGSAHRRNREAAQRVTDETFAQMRETLERGAEERRRNL